MVKNKACRGAFHMRPGSWRHYAGRKNFEAAHRAAIHQFYYLLSIIFYLKNSLKMLEFPYVKLQPLHQTPDDDRARL